MKPQARGDVFDSERDVIHTEDPFLEEDENDGADFACSDDSDGEADDDAVPKKRRKKERKVPVSEEEAERKRVLANSQERERMDRLNRALANLRKALPPHFSVCNRRLSKIRTLRLAIRYIRDLSNMLAADDAMIERHPPFHHHHQQHLQYPQCPLPHPQPFHVFQSPSFVASPNFPSDGSHGDEGYSSFFSESHRLQESSFLGTPYPSTPSHPHPFVHPPVHTVSPDEGFGGGNVSSFLSPIMDSSLIPADGPWMSSTPTGGHFVGNVVPRTFEDCDGGHGDGRNRATFLEPSPGSGGMGVGMGTGVGVTTSRPPQLHLGSGGFVSPCHFSTPVNAPSGCTVWSAPCPPDVTPL